MREQGKLLRRVLAAQVELAAEQPLTLTLTLPLTLTPTLTLTLTLNPNQVELAAEQRSIHAAQARLLWR